MSNYGHSDDDRLACHRALRSIRGFLCLRVAKFDEGGFNGVMVQGKMVFFTIQR